MDTMPANGNRLKGTVPRDFRLQVFFMNQFPQAPENLQIYSQLKVHHQVLLHLWQMEKILNPKSLNYFVWTDTFG
jgi:hypothetical protein